VEAEADVAAAEQAFMKLAAVVRETADKAAVMVAEAAGQRPFAIRRITLSP
jgi:hypothetical protein